MDFPTWLKSRYRNAAEDESITHAIHRLAFQVGVGWTTVYRAWKGSRVQPHNARKLSDATVPPGKVKPLVSFEALAEAPTRPEQAAAKRAAS